MRRSLFARPLPSCLPSFSFRAMRRFPPYQHAIDYFPVSVVKTADLDPGRNYLLGSHPHGVVCFGAFMSFVVDNPQFRELFPGKFIPRPSKEFNAKLQQIQMFIPTCQKFHYARLSL